ncbi:MAG: phosphoribosyltransferase family protein [Bacteroidota bacterium]
MKAFISDFISLLYPDLCQACGHSLLKGEEVICIRCQMQLPRTNYHQDVINPIIKHFWGKVPVHAATAYYFFYKGEKVQHLIHRLKYKNCPEVGVKVGFLLGNELKESQLYNDVQVIVPVPLHEDKLRIRGYNQSEEIAKGLSQSYQVESANLIMRLKHTETQTRKHRFQRYQNVDKVFAVTEEKEVYGKHILLVDDVITTGSTLVACAEELLKVHGAKVSVAAMAYAAK